MRARPQPILGHGGRLGHLRCHLIGRVMHVGARHLTEPTLFQRPRRRPSLARLHREQTTEQRARAGGQALVDRAVLGGANQVFELELLGG